jgi:hypothetical protein
VTMATAMVLGGSACSHIDLPPRVLDPDPTLTPCDGITVAVDGRALAGTGDGGYAEPSATCVPTAGAITAQAALTDAVVTVTTATSPDDSSVVCRVDGDPFDGLAVARPGGGTHVETCGSAPPDYARWVVWTRAADGEWTSEHQDLTTLTLGRGDAVELVYSYRGEPPAPRS